MKFLTTGLSIGVAVFLAGALAAQEKEDTKAETVSVTAKSITLDVPATWKKKEPSSEMRAAQFDIPPGESDEEGAELVVYHFGGPTGGTKANVQRWIDQFYADGRKHELVSGNSREGKYVMVTLSGTYKKPVGPPAAQQTTDKPNSRVIGIVLVADVDGAEDYYFLKMDGPDALVEAQADHLRKAIGADRKSEKPIKLEDLRD
jgi:gluconolactonase